VLVDDRVSRKFRFDEGRGQIFSDRWTRSIEGGKSPTLNQVMLIGYAGQNSEMKFTAAGIPVANFSLAVKEVYKNGGGEKKTIALWIRCVAWRRWAEIA